MEHRKEVLLQSHGEPSAKAITDGRCVYVSALTPENPETGHIAAGIRAQTKQVLENLFAVLRQAGTTPENLLKVDITLADLRCVDAVNEVYARMVPQPYPARSCRGSHQQRALIEVSAVALCGSEGPTLCTAACDAT